MVTWETNTLLAEVAKDASAIGRETGWVWPGLADFCEDLRKIALEKILRGTFRGMRRVE
jgi:hypothetical protein